MVLNDRNSNVAMSDTQDNGIVEISGKEDGQKPLVNVCKLKSSKESNANKACVDSESSNKKNIDLKSPEIKDSAQDANDISVETPSAVNGNSSVENVSEYKISNYNLDTSIDKIGQENKTLSNAKVQSKVDVKIDASIKLKNGKGIDVKLDAKNSGNNSELENEISNFDSTSLVLSKEKQRIADLLNNEDKDKDDDCNHDFTSDVAGESSMENVSEESDQVGVGSVCIKTEVNSLKQEVSGEMTEDIIEVEDNLETMKIEIGEAYSEVDKELIVAKSSVDDAVAEESCLAGDDRQNIEVKEGEEMEERDTRNELKVNDEGASSETKSAESSLEMAVSEETISAEEGVSSQEMNEIGEASLQKLQPTEVTMSNENEVDTSNASKLTSDASDEEVSNISEVALEANMDDSKSDVAEAESAQSINDDECEITIDDGPEQLDVVESNILENALIDSKQDSESNVGNDDSDISIEVPANEVESGGKESEKKAMIKIRSDLLSEPKVNDVAESGQKKSGFSFEVKKYLETGEATKRSGEVIEGEVSSKRTKFGSPTNVAATETDSSKKKSAVDARPCLADTADEDADDPSPLPSRSPSPAPSSSTDQDCSSSIVQPLEQDASAQGFAKRRPLAASIRLLRENVLKKLTKNDLEELMVQKLCESICDRSETGALRRRAEALEEEAERWRERAMSCEKQVRELETVLKKFLAERDKMGGVRTMVPIRVTRSVGLQVSHSMVPKKPPQPPPPPPQPTSAVQRVVMSPRGPALRGMSPLRPPGSGQAVSRPPPPLRLAPPLRMNSPQGEKPGIRPVRKILPISPAAQASISPTQAKSFRIVTPAKVVASPAASSSKADSGIIDLTDDEPLPSPSSSKKPGPNQKVTYLVNSPQTSKYLIAPGGVASGVAPPPIMFKGYPRATGPVRHPAPLPALPPTQPHHHSWKAIPPRPALKISSTTSGIVLSWDMALSSEHEKIASYQLYAYQQGNSPPSHSLWREVGDVKALPLPMACTLSCFVPGHRYHFSVRAVDIHCRVGPFSLPGSILLKGAMTGPSMS